MTGPIPDQFTAKKQRILAALSVPESEYFDNSPKGSVDEPIRELIDLINSYPGWCTTSSCSGRVTVFVEGPKNGSASADGLEVENGNGEDDDDSEGGTQTGTKKTSARAKKITKAGPGGKGGGHWLFVSHSALGDTTSTDQLNITDLESPSTPIQGDDDPVTTRLVHLSFSPLILHVLCASLDHARPLLAAAINAGFRESGVPSLKVLEEPEKGVMVAIRTAGLAFSTVVGEIALGRGAAENRRVVVSEEYLRMCLRVVNERFKANEERKRRLEQEVQKIEEQAPPGEETIDSLFDFDR
ncbi:hypothetical protein DV735_g2015, partial [Chaetothyriales sp. CBS 134920]